MSTQRYFNILGIPPTKNEKLIKRAYRKKVMKYHPDRNYSAAAKDRFIEVTEAYDRILLAIERKESSRSTRSRSIYRENNSGQTQQSQTRTQKSTAKKRPTVSEVREERVKEARKRYEYMERKEAHENERYFQAITGGKIWKRFMITMYACTLVSLLMVLDILYFPTNNQQSQIIKRNTKITYEGAGRIKTSPVVFENGQKAWIPVSLIVMEENSYMYLERTLFFKEIKYVKIWRNNQWRYYIPDYSAVSFFPLFPLILLIPLLTFFLKGRTITFSLFFHISYYAVPIFLIVVLLSNDRWAHLLTLGLMG